ncbi:neuronal acetylcholine receptor subunit beta-4 [Musca vetustissima]|uniref:neuronal acetylcholine receptor subunit beta-4 n=1 Tax=Musca vetustissima TaxID=27455 RepID=UPI002AB72A6F|nr:neuronal acetylcholine receptor subunit beta-4 [Musca vetustissima]
MIVLRPTKADFKYNVSLAQMDTCRHYTIPMNRGYNYADFFHLTHLKNNKLADNELLHLKFYVMTARDAHILLSSTDQPRSKDKVYEVVIGAGRNTFSTIRITMGRGRVATNQDPYILSMLDPTPIEIIQTKAAELLVYITGFKEEPLLNFTDTSPLDIQYISFTTYDNIPASWFYDCQFDGFANELEEEVRELTPHQLLVANITAMAENGSYPVDLTSVEFDFVVASVSYQHDRGMLQTRLNLRMNWVDSRITWDPKAFGDIDVIQHSDYDIWLPHLMVINGVSNSKSLLDEDHKIKIRHNGEIGIEFYNVFITTWCPNPFEDWPNEELSCDIVVGLDQGPLQRLTLNYNDTWKHPPIDSLSEWTLRGIHVTSVASGANMRYTDKQILQAMDGDIAIEFFIVRNSGFYRNVFSMPILASQILIILSFLLRGYRRGALILVVMVVLMLGLMFLTKHAPTFYVPPIMLAYQHIMRVATFCYILHICLMWLELYPPKAKPYDWLTAAVNCSPLRLVLCMRLADSNDYIDSQQQPWREVAKVLNAMSFVVINVVCIVVVVTLLPHA